MLATPASEEAIKKRRESRAKLARQEVIQHIQTKKRGSVTKLLRSGERPTSVPRGRAPKSKITQKQPNVKARKAESSKTTHKPAPTVSADPSSSITNDEKTAFSEEVPDVAVSAEPVEAISQVRVVTIMDAEVCPKSDLCTDSIERDIQPDDVSSVLEDRSVPSERSFGWTMEDNQQERTSRDVKYDGNSDLVSYMSLPRSDTGDSIEQVPSSPNNHTAPTDFGSRYGPVSAPPSRPSSVIGISGEWTEKPLQGRASCGELRPSQRIESRPTSAYRSLAYSPTKRSDRPSTPSVVSTTANSTVNTVPDDDTARRVDRILDFLKGVEEDDAQKAASIRAGPAAIGGLLGDLHGPPNQTFMNTTTGNSAAVFDGVKAKIMGQQMEIEEKTRTLGVLKKELKKLKENLREQALEFKKELKSKLSLQRKEYETIIKRHLTFIDKLLAEKEELTKKCEVLTEEVKTLEKQYQNKSRILEEQHEKDLKQQRELWQAAEKIKRDKWIQEKTKAIKDQTIKGLEPEIQRMLSQQKLQIRQMEEKYREDLAQEKTLLVEQQQRQMEAMRDRIVAERQRACEEEREFARQRYQKQLERDEMEFQQQKRKLLADFDEQKHALMDSYKQERQAEDSAHRKQIEELRRQIDGEREAKEQALEDIRRKHNAELANLREKLAIEKEEWQTHYMAKQEAEMRNREKIFKEKLIRERDAEIEMVVQRLESETSCNSSEATRRYRMEIERLKAEMAEEVKQLRDQHNLALDKLLAAQNQLRKSEDGRRNVEKKLLLIQHEITAKENLIRDQKNELSRLKVNEETLIERIRHDFEENLDAKEATLRALAEELADHDRQIETLQRKHCQEMDEVTRQKDAAVNLIEERVRKALTLKDELVNSLKLQLEDLGIKNAHLERLIDKQRQELLS